VTYQIQLMMQSMLVERFNLKVHREMREGPVFALVVAKGGPKFLNTKYPELDAVLRDTGLPPAQPAHMPPCTRGLACMTRRMSMSELAYTLWDFGDHGVVSEIGRPVIDQTGLTGDYDIQLQWAPEFRPGMFMGPINANPGAGAGPPAESSGPSFMTALQEQLGLKLEPTKGSVEYVVVDHVDRPSEN
jgi:uncharacterized protein (TIGR03435 family)